MSGRVNDQYYPQAHSINAVAPRWLPPPPDQLERLRTIASKNPSAVQTQDEYSPLLKSNGQVDMSNYNRRNDSYASSSGFNAVAGGSKGNYTGGPGSNHARNDRDQRAHEDDTRYDPRASNMRASNARSGSSNRRGEDMPFSAANSFDRRNPNETASRQRGPPSPRTLMTAYGLNDKAPPPSVANSVSFGRDRPNDRSENLRRDRLGDRQRDDDRHERQRSGDTNWQSKRPRLDEGPSALRLSGRQQDHSQASFAPNNASKLDDRHNRRGSDKYIADEEYNPHAPRGRSRSRSPKVFQNHRHRSASTLSSRSDDNRYRPRGGPSKSRQDESRRSGRDRDVDKSKRNRRSRSLESNTRTTGYGDRNDRSRRHQQQRKASRSPDLGNRRRRRSRSRSPAVSMRRDVSPPRTIRPHDDDEYDPKSRTNGMRKWGQQQASQPGLQGSRDHSRSHQRSRSPPGYDPHAGMPDPFYPPQPSHQGPSAPQIGRNLQNSSEFQGYGGQPLDTRQQPSVLLPLQILPPPSVLLSAAARSAPLQDIRPLTIGVHALPQSSSGLNTAPAKKGFRPVGNPLPVVEPGPFQRQLQPSEELRRYFSQDDDMAPPSDPNISRGFASSAQYSPQPGSARMVLPTPQQLSSLHVQQPVQQQAQQSYQQQQPPHQRQQQQFVQAGQQRPSFTDPSQRYSQDFQQDSRQQSAPHRSPSSVTQPQSPPSPAYQASSSIENRLPDTPRLSDLPAGLPEKPASQSNAKAAKTTHAPLFPRLVASSNAKGIAGLPSKPKTNGTVASASLPAKPSLAWQQSDKTGQVTTALQSPSLSSAVSLTASPESSNYRPVSAKSGPGESSASGSQAEGTLSALQGAIMAAPKQEGPSRSSTRDRTDKAADAEASHTPAETLAPTPDVYEGKKSAVKINNEFYERIAQVGEGTYGKVYKARNAKAGGLVAMKRIRMEGEKDGFPVTALREIKLLQNLDHPNVIKLLEMMVSKGHVYMVFEYADHDLTGILHHPTISFTPANLKSLMLQLLQGLDYIHWRGVLHRDLKGSNILLSRNGDLYIADFGLAKFYAKGKRNDYTNRVITQWYKPPELLFGTTVYGPEVDMWSAGCIFLELFTKRPVFQGLDEINQLDVIYKFMGTPRSEDWPELPELPWYELVKPRREQHSAFRKVFSPEYIKSPAALDLAEALLKFNPASRPSAYEAALLPYFTEEQPPPEKPTWLADIKGDWHEMESKEASRRKTKELKKQQQQQQEGGSAGSSK